MSRDIKVSILGAGSWGTGVACLAAQNVDTTIWARSADAAEEIHSEHRNSKYLGDLELPETLKATADLEEAVWDCDVLVMGIPAQQMRAVLEDVKEYVRPWIPVVSLSKGLERGTRLRMTQVIDQVLPGHSAGTLAGPNLAKEIVRGFAAAAVIAMPDEEVARSLQPIFASKVFRVYTNTDVCGCELGGSLKNVVAIASGMGDGLQVGDNTRAMVITRGLAEMTRLGVALGGDARTFPGLTGMGDLMATCISPLSRNRTFGEKLGEGMTVDEAAEAVGQVVEGAKSARTVMELAAECDVLMPIAAEVDAVVNEGRSADEAFRGLRRMKPTSEIHGVA